MTARPLAGRRVLVTRERPGELGRLLAERGAEVLHVPLIEIAEPLDDGAARDAALAELGAFDWLVVTSPAGAERVGAAARAHPAVRLATVGTGTAEVLARLAGRPVDLVPERQVGAALAEALLADLADRGPHPARVLLALGDLAATTLADALAAGGHAVTTVTAYRTTTVRPGSDTWSAADALTLASGSAARSWVEVFGTSAPPIVVVIGPTTAAVAAEVGLKVTAVAADHSLDGLVRTLERCFSRDR